MHSFILNFQIFIYYSLNLYNLANCLPDKLLTFLKFMLTIVAVSFIL